MEDPLPTRQVPEAVHTKIDQPDPLGVGQEVGRGLAAQDLAAVGSWAERHNVPFYIAAPLSTIDQATPTGAEIPIEERSGDEVTTVFDTRVAPLDAPAANFAFDVTPNELIAALITDVGVLRPPYTESIARAFERRETA